MANLNKVMLIGRLTRDPEPPRTFANGGKVIKFGFAVSNRKKNAQTGEWVDEPVFIDVEAFNRGEFGKLADNVEQYFRKGKQFYIEGHLRLDQWKDKTTGDNRQRLLLVMENFQFLEPRQEGAATPQRSSAPSRSYGAPSPSDFESSGGSHMEPAPPGADEGDIPF